MKNTILIVKEKCKCPCHTNKSIVHITECCNNGYKTKSK